MPWFWNSFVALCQFCVRFGTVYVAGAADVGEMLKTHRFFSMFDKSVGFVVGIEQFCGGGGDDFASGEDHEDRVVDGAVDVSDVVDDDNNNPVNFDVDVDKDEVINC